MPDDKSQKPGDVSSIPPGDQGARMSGEAFDEQKARAQFNLPRYAKDFTVETDASGNQVLNFKSPTKMLITPGREAMVTKITMTGPNKFIFENKDGLYSDKDSPIKVEPLSKGVVKETFAKPRKFDLGGKSGVATEIIRGNAETTYLNPEGLYGADTPVSAKKTRQGMQETYAKPVELAMGAGRSGMVQEVSTNVRGDKVFKNEAGLFGPDTAVEVHKEGYPAKFTDYDSAGNLLRDDSASRSASATAEERTKEGLRTRFNIPPNADFTMQKEENRRLRITFAEPTELTLPDGRKAAVKSILRGGDMITATYENADGLLGPGTPIAAKVTEKAIKDTYAKPIDVATKDGRSASVSSIVKLRFGSRVLENPDGIFGPGSPSELTELANSVRESYRTPKTVTLTDGREAQASEIVIGKGGQHTYINYFGLFGPGTAKQITVKPDGSTNESSLDAFPVEVEPGKQAYATDVHTDKAGNRTYFRKNGLYGPGTVEMIEQTTDGRLREIKDNRLGGRTASSSQEGGEKLSDAEREQYLSEGNSRFQFTQEPDVSLDRFGHVEYRFPSPTKVTIGPNRVAVVTSISMDADGAAHLQNPDGISGPETPVQLTLQENGAEESSYLTPKHIKIGDKTATVALASKDAEGNLTYRNDAGLFGPGTAVRIDLPDSGDPIAYDASDNRTALQETALRPQRGSPVGSDDAPAAMTYTPNQDGTIARERGADAVIAEEFSPEGMRRVADLRDQLGKKANRTESENTTLKALTEFDPSNAEHRREVTEILRRTSPESEGGGIADGAGRLVGVMILTSAIMQWYQTHHPNAALPVQPQRARIY